MKPKLSTFTQRYKFKECRQKSDESVSAYLASLKQISLHCDFGPNLDSNLREQLVWRLYSERMTKRLLAEPNLTLERAIEICTALEATERDIADMGRESSSSNRGSTVNYISKKQKGPVKKQKDRPTCFCCGKSNHKANDCRFREFTCNACCKKRHLKVICKSNGEGNLTSVA